MSGWAGFTDAELVKLKSSGGKGDGLPPGVRKQSNFGKPKSVPQRKIIQSQKSTASTQETGVISPDERLSRTNNNVKQDHKRQTQTTSDSHVAKESTPSTRKSEHPRDTNGNVNTNTVGESGCLENQKPDIEFKELDRSEALSLEMSKLEKYQQQQKMIEELNNQRKQILAKAISERSKKAKAEASKLKHIEKELGHLDHLLTADVSLIRDRIEEASIAFMDAQKRYQKAEKEFVDAKIHLHQKAELKEQLTEHLYTIIHQNEVRKSQKLAQLMSQLEMEIDMDGADVNLVDLPSLMSFNTVQTLSPNKTLSTPSFPIQTQPVEDHKAELLGCQPSPAVSQTEPQTKSDSESHSIRSTTTTEPEKLSHIDPSPEAQPTELSPDLIPSEPPTSMITNSAISAEDSQADRPSALQTEEATNISSNPPAQAQMSSDGS